MNKQNDLSELVATMMQVWRLYGRSSEFQLKDKQTTMLQHFSLLYLDKHPNTTLSNLALDMHMSLSSATQFIDRLAKAGLVKRNSDKKDRRVVRIALTNKGQEEIAGMRQKRAERMKKLFGNLSDKDLSDFLRIYKNLLTSLELK